MQLASSTPIPDGLLATIALRNENSRLGVPSSEAALHLGHDASKSEIVLGIEAADSTTRVRSSDTGKERDAESGNDYFGARYYASTMGRFMSPDWSKSPEAVPYADLEKPQTLNLYTYADNNPLSVTDADGHSPDWWQKFTNWLGGNGWYTNDQLTDQHRSWLLEQAKTDTEAQNIKNANAKDVNDNYNCLHNSGCAQNYANTVQQLIQAGSMLTPWGWRGQPSYNDALKKLNQPNTPQGTTDLPEGVDGKVPTRTQAKQMIEDAGGKVIRGEETGHAPGGNSPHTYPHINYETAQGMKGTIRVQ